jgi:MFS transporter, DHA1 family, tetracycline resistance protein
MLAKSKNIKSSNPSSNATNTTIITLIVLITIEMMGMGIIFPLLPELFISHSSTIVAPNTTEALRCLYYGLSICLWPLGMFFGTPYLGELSDKFGRKKIFVLCLLMTALGYAFTAAAIYLHSVWLFFASRLWAGIFAGSCDLAQAAVADISTQENKARNMGWIIFATGIGLIIGPIITSFTGNNSFILQVIPALHTLHPLNAEASITTPLWIASCLALLNATWIGLAFRDTLAQQHRQHAHKVSFAKIFSSFLFVIVDARLTKLVVIFFFLISGWFIFFIDMPLILASAFHLPTATVGIFFALVGFGNIITVALVQPFLLSRLSLKAIIIYTSLASALVMLLLWLLLAWREPLLLPFNGILVLLFSIVELLAYISCIAFISNTVAATEQGKTMGGIAAINNLVFMLISLVAPVLSTINLRLPLLCGALSLAITALLMWKHRTGQAI